MKCDARKKQPVVAVMERAVELDLAVHQIAVVQEAVQKGALLAIKIQLARNSARRRVFNPSHKIMSGIILQASFVLIAKI
ncbi:MAG: hypothetical protein J6X37_03185 [Treponema sp.]|nr:hypothetical protein [Treponema sp.]